VPAALHGHASKRIALDGGAYLSETSRFAKAIVGAAAVSL
jgi:hypothetical protein